MIPGSAAIETVVLKKITPTKKQRKEIEHAIDALQKQVSKEINKTGLPITIELVGSTAKDTYIRTAVDIDLFLVFPTTTSREQLQRNGLAIGRAILTNQEECFAEHPYVRGMYHGHKTEIVPCYKIESASQKLSAVDRTPLHTDYVRKHLKEAQKKDVRLFKQFLRGIGCYGAEAEIEGFSGYLCEILIIKFKTFQRLITAAQHWRPGEVLTLTKTPIPRFETPLIFIDPVDSERNVASALSNDKFDLFRAACKAYAKQPRLTFFFPKALSPWPLEKIKKEIGNKEYVGVRLPKPDIIPENLYPQVRKAVRSITELCTHYGFQILDTHFYIDKKEVYILLHPQSMLLPKTVVHPGPPITLKKNIDEFLEKWKDSPRVRKEPYEKNNRIYIDIERDYTDIHDLLQRQVKELSLGKHIDHLARTKYSVVDQKDLVTNKFRLFWTTVLDSKMSWER
jgi:tRNA nucleotidyltransferase (CCA-adding enzyme)